MRVEPWTDDLPLLEGLLGDPTMMTHLGGPELPEKIASRNADYAHDDSRQYRIVADGVGAGWVGYWERDWRGRGVFEIGWSVLPAFQGAGLATLGAAAVLEVVRSEREPRDVHAFPSVDNGASNAVCRKLGFIRVGELDFPYYRGNLMRCNDWRHEVAR